MTVKKIYCEMCEGFKPATISPAGDNPGFFDIVCECSFVVATFEDDGGDL